MDGMSVPASILAGVTVEFIVPVPNAFNGGAGYALSMKLVSSTATISVSSDNFTAVGNEFEAEIPAATTAAWAPGKYEWFAFAINGGDKRHVGKGRVEVLPDVQASTSGVDTRSHAARMVDLIQAMLEGRATTDQQEATLDGVALKRYSWEELGELRAKYLSEMKAEEARAAGKNRSTIRIKFTGK